MEIKISNFFFTICYGIESNFVGFGMQYSVNDLAIDPVYMGEPINLQYRQ